MLLLTLLACNFDKLDDECTDGDEQCSIDGSEVEACEDGTWVSWQTCDEGCETNEGVPECVEAEPASD